MAAQTYRDLIVWQKSMDLVVEGYRIAKGFPRGEQFGLTSQLQRALVSVPANIAEGNGRLHRGDYVHHLSVARGSLAEAETHMLLAVRLGYSSSQDVDQIWPLFQEVGRLLSGLIRSLDRATS